MAKDPSIGAAGWLEHGAPAGLLESPTLPSIFPSVDADDNMYLDPMEVNYEVEAFTNDKGIDLESSWVCSLTSMWARVLEEGVTTGALLTLVVLPSCRGSA